VGRHSSVGIANPGGGEIFRNHPDRPWGPLSFLYNVYRVSFLEVKRPGLDLEYPFQSSAEVKEIVELYLYSVSVTLWTVTGELHLDLYVNSSVVV